MSSRKISGYDAIASVATDDLLVVVDVSDTSMASSGTTKKATVAQLPAGISPPAGDIGGTQGSPTVVSTHLSAALPVAQGGTGQATQQAALDALAGAVTAAEVLAGNGTHVTLRALAAADLPAATTSLQGAVILDGTAADMQPTGVAAAGNSTKAAAGNHVHPYQAYQFLPESYGAKRDGKFLYDASMNGTTAVLTTAGLPAPSAPTVTPSGSGGTVLAGTYLVQVTYVNQYGETLASTATSVTTTGTTSTITVTSPLPWTNATGYYVYCTQAGGGAGTETRQQTAGNPTALRTSYVISAPPTNTGAAPPVANTSNSAPFTAGDVGKAIVVPSAGGFLNVPLVTTIASYQSATQVTLAAASTRAVTGSGAVYGTDDTAAIQSAINAAVAYAQTAGQEQATCEVIFSNGIYCVAGALTGTYQNAQVTLPYVDPYVGPKVNLKLTGPQEANGPTHWEQPNPTANGAVLASIYYSDSASPPSPNPVVIGGPVSGGGLNFGGNGGLFSNMRVVVDGLNILVAYRPSICGLDLSGVGQADIKSLAYFAMARTGTAAGGWPPYQNDTGNPSPWTVTGYKTPATGNNAQNDLDRLTVYGPWYAVLFADHFTAASIKAIFCAFGAAGVQNGGTSHHCSIQNLVFETGTAALFGQSGSTIPLTVGSVAVETVAGPGSIIDDTPNAFYGEVHAENQTNTGVQSGAKNGGANIRLIWDYQTLGAVASPPAVPSSTTAYTNQYWRDAVVIVTGGTVSAIAIDGKTTGLTSGPVPVRSGGTITLTYSVAPTWAWILA